MSSDVQAKRVTGTGSLAVGPARIRQIHVLSGSGTPRLTISDGNGGATVLDLDLKASDVHAVNIPDAGIRVSDIYVATATALTAVTVFYN
jgi:hypothetical protein